MGYYLDMPLRRPVVFLDRERVARRHLHAFLLGEFFDGVSRTRVGAMDAYGRMGRFCGKPQVSRWEKGAPRPLILESDANPPLSKQFADFLDSLRQGRNKSDFEEHIDYLLSATSIARKSQKGEGLLRFAANLFRISVQSWEKDYDTLLDQWNGANTQGQANAIFYQLRLRYNTTVIEALADRQFLPRYGFPINVMKLRVTSPSESRSNRIREEDQFRLERYSLLALQEYVPGSQLLVGGQLIRSRGILKHWTGEDIDSTIGLRGRYAKCRNNHLYYWTSGEVMKDCPFCREPAMQSPMSYIVPQYGFSSAAWDPPSGVLTPSLLVT